MFTEEKQKKTLKQIICPISPTISSSLLTLKTTYFYFEKYLKKILLLFTDLLPYLVLL